MRSEAELRSATKFSEIIKHPLLSKRVRYKQ